ncbi:MAG: hypothetical protein CVU05_07345 [Bacteroidetes bacterium HGW-Bacteroidetes-21]|nr:MAG: hypothetical protein CVU05_07345 [Bacteroidetes bacterium HGW-Bacteroidetes-21]
MKTILTFTFAFLLIVQLFGQETIKGLVSQGNKLHDLGKYDEAILKYKAALKLDENSTLANYELSYTYMTIRQYADAVKYSTKVIKQNTENQHEAYIVLGSSLDLLGKPGKAIKAYEEGLNKYPNSNLLNFNLALTSFNSKDYNKAEDAVIKAIQARPTHASSHMLLAVTMIAKGQRVKSVLALYYALMLEPNSKRSSANYESLMLQLDQGVVKKDEKNINVNVSFNENGDNEFQTAEVMISLLAASKFTEDNEGKSKMESFIQTTKGLFGILGEIKKENKGFFWDFYVTKFSDLVKSENNEAFCYYISQSTNSDEVKNWINSNQEKIEKLKDWITKN